MPGGTGKGKSYVIKVVLNRTTDKLALKGVYEYMYGFGSTLIPVEPKVEKKLLKQLGIKKLPIA